MFTNVSQKRRHIWRSVTFLLCLSCEFNEKLLPDINHAQQSFSINIEALRLIALNHRIKKLLPVQSFHFSTTHWHSSIFQHNNSETGLSHIEKIVTYLNRISIVDREVVFIFDVVNVTWVEISVQNAIMLWILENCYIFRM